jgi:hypothetical protein
MMHESKYLLDTGEFFARHPEMADTVKELAKKDMEKDDYDMFSFIVTYIFM